MKKNQLVCRITGIAAATCAFAQMPATAHAEKPLSLSVSVGGEYDSNVSVEQTDVLTHQGDGALLLGASARYNLLASDQGSLYVGYEFDQSLHASLGNYDLQTHALSAGGGVKLGGAKLGVDYSFFHILLGGKRFLDMHFVSPSISGFVAKPLYLRASYTYLRKNFTVATTRDADTSQASAQAFYFFMNSKAYFNVDGRYERETTADPIYSYKGFQLRAALQLPVTLLGAQSKIRVRYGYRKRDYDEITPSIGERRRENRSVITLMAKIPLSKKLELRPEYRYVDRNSNYAFSNYVEHVGTANLTYNF